MIPCGECIFTVYRQPSYCPTIQYHLKLCQKCHSLSQTSSALPPSVAPLVNKFFCLRNKNKRKGFETQKQVLNLRSRNQIRGKLLHSQKLWHFRGSLFSHCFVPLTSLHYSSPRKVLCFHVFPEGTVTSQKLQVYCLLWNLFPALMP